MAVETSQQWITPDWPAPGCVKAVSTTRIGGVSEGDFASLNLATHVGDDPNAVRENRRCLRQSLRLEREPAWLNQVHGTNVIAAEEFEMPPSADASFTTSRDQPCVVMTADCLPVLFCNRAGTHVGAAHAGWRGLVGGILAKTVAALNVDPQELLAWLGPAIEPAAFEVGPEVREQFLARDANDEAAFVANSRGRWQADIYELARRELQRLQITQIYGGGFQCFADSERFFSYRRHSRTGRMASLVWIL